MELRQIFLLLPLFSFICIACRESEAVVAHPGLEKSLVAQRGDLKIETLVTGELYAEEAVVLEAPNINIWPVQIRWLAEDGSEVKAGAPVAEIDNTQVTSRLEELRVRVFDSNSRLQSFTAEAAADEARKTFELAENEANFAKASLDADVEESLYSKLQYEELQLAKSRAELRLADSRRQLQALLESNRTELEILRTDKLRAENELQRAQADIDRLVLRAPRDGIVIFAMNRREGRTFVAGDSIFPGQNLARIPNLDTLMVKAQLPDVDDGRIATGMEVLATLDAFPETPFQGRVRSIAKVAGEPQRFSLRRFFDTEIDLGEIDTERMRPGMSVKVLIVNPLKDRILVPRESLDWSEGGARVYLADGEFKPVTLGPCNTVQCEVRDGLSPGEALGLATAETGG